ncbi:auxin-responsive protein SAUR32-like [Lycium barbarum]|uniref:auxin-responsive protein SAUR32-like n=1 Tax=Lycium barbarum TaxID=112863 RepID=UPI00293F5546|nr:auxin-responsive protein SAUR32-like [Lycium barbarum]
MRSGNKRHHHHHLNFHAQVNFPFHLHHHHHHNGHDEKKEQIDVPRGCVTVLVGKGEEQQKFVIPVMHINHPLFTQLLKEAEEVYGFHHNGPINIPCHVEEFRYVEGMIDKDNAAHHHQHHLWCFKA